MIQARHGDTVKVHYIGRLGNGRGLSTSKGGAPLEVKIGSQGHIVGLERGLIGMKPGETKTITVPPEEGHGQEREELIVNVPKSDFPEDISPAIGKRVQLRKEGGGRIELTIKRIDEDTVTLDGNHPLAGETLTLEVQLLEVV